MIEPYRALGLVPTMRGIRRRDEIATNLEHLSHLIKAASWLSSLDLLMHKRNIWVRPDQG